MDGLYGPPDTARGILARLLRRRLRLRLRLTAAGPAFPDEPQPIARPDCRAAREVLWADVDPAEVESLMSARSNRAARNPDAGAKG